MHLARLIDAEKECGARHRSNRRRREACVDATESAGGDESTRRLQPSIKRVKGVQRYINGETGNAARQ